jgi:hypothetical protein
MARGHKIDIVAAPLSKMNHHGAKVFWLHLHPFTLMTNIIILAKAAKQIARAHKYGPRAIPSHKGSLFPKMGVVTGDLGLPPCLTKTPFPLQPVNAACARAKMALFYKAQCLLKAGREFTIAVKSYIGRLHGSQNLLKQYPPGKRRAAPGGYCDLMVCGGFASPILCSARISLEAIKRD